MVQIYGSGGYASCGGANRVHDVAYGQENHAEETVKNPRSTTTEQISKKYRLPVVKEPVPIKRGRRDDKDAGK